MPAGHSSILTEPAFPPLHPSSSHQLARFGLVGFPALAIPCQCP